MTQKRSEVFTADMTDAATQFSIPLPSPERYRHVYTFTTDDIEDPAEFTALMSSLQSVSSNFRSLYGKLIREDSQGNPLGRTAVTYEALHRMVGQEWYDLANDLQGKKIGVKNTYKFYVKDEEGSKLNMICLDKGTYKQMGTYLVIAPDGIRIEQDDNSTGVFDSGDIFTYRVNGYDLAFQVNRNGKDCRLIGVPENYTGALVIPSTVYELNVIEMDEDVTKDLGGVTSLTIPGTYRDIFNEFNELNFRELILKNGVRNLSTWSFRGCTKLTTITLPPTLYHLGGASFSYSPAIRTINCEGTVPPSLGEGIPWGSIFSPVVYENATVYVPKGCVSVYQRTYPWSSFKKIVEAGTNLNK